MSRLTKNTLADALAAMKGICSNPESPTALPEALSQLTDGRDRLDTLKEYYNESSIFNKQLND